jgi:hypothetical protein
MLRCLVGLIKLPFVLTGVLLELTFGLVGGLLSVLGVMLIPVFGVGLLILPVGLVFLLLAWVLDKML